MNKILQITGLTCVVILLFAVPAATPTLQGTSVQYSSAVVEAEALALPKDVLGLSGNLRALIGTPTYFAESSTLRPFLSGVALAEPGVHSLRFQTPDGDSLVVVTLESFDSIQGARLDGYRVGQWPTTGLAARDTRYARPSGFIPVTQENKSTSVSKRFQLGDFLTHDQKDVWPKVLVLRPALLDKLELVGDELERRGLPSRLHVMSGFRTPQYNEKGVGAKGGRASQSRHMYGDAADVFVDGNRDGKMDDLDGDGKSTIRDARVLYAVAEGVETEHPDLVGGLSAYPANSAHGPFVHMDTRGKRARW